MARRWLVAVLLIAAACSKKEGEKPADKPADQPAEKPADKPADPGVKPTTPDVPATPPAKIKQATNVDDLGLLPVDSEMVVGVNIAQIQTSPMWKDFLAPRVMSDEVKAKLDEFKTKCSIDPLQAVKSASIGFKDTASGKEGVAVVHGLYKAKVMACADKMKA